jgi:hypothetical protein
MIGNSPTSAGFLQIRDMYIDGYKLQATGAGSAYLCSLNRINGLSALTNSRKSTTAKGYIY